MKKTVKILASQQEVLIDAEDLGRVSEHSWRVTQGTTGRPRVVTSIRTPKGVRTLTLGKFLMDPPKGKHVYPRRFNEGLDYRKDNLIVCTVQERQQLITKQRVNRSSQYRGVSFQKAKAKWRAGIQVDGKSYNLGEYSTEEEAALAYNKASKKHFGEHAYQNPIGRKKSLRK